VGGIINIIPSTFGEKHPLYSNRLGGVPRIFEELSHHKVFQKRVSACGNTSLSLPGRRLF